MDDLEIGTDKLVEVLKDPQTSKKNFDEAVERIKIIELLQQ